MTAFAARSRDWLEIARASVDDARARAAAKQARLAATAERAAELRALADQLTAEAQALLAEAEALRCAADTLHETKLPAPTLHERISANAERTRQAIAVDLARIGGDK